MLQINHETGLAIGPPVEITFNGNALPLVEGFASDGTDLFVAYTLEANHNSTSTHLGTIDSVTGAITECEATLGHDMDALGFSPESTLFSMDGAPDGVHLGKYNGCVFLHPEIGVFDGPTANDMTFTSCGTLYNIDRLTNELRWINPMDATVMGAVEIAPPDDATFRGLAFLDVCLACPEDLDGNGTVDIVDLLQLLTAWGICPSTAQE